MFVRGEQPPLKNRPSPTVLHNIPGVLGEYCKYGQSGKKKPCSVLFSRLIGKPLAYFLKL